MLDISIICSFSILNLETTTNCEILGRFLSQAWINETYQNIKNTPPKKRKRDKPKISPNKHSTNAKWTLNELQSVNMRKPWIAPKMIAKLSPANGTPNAMRMSDFWGSTHKATWGRQRGRNCANVHREMVLFSPSFLAIYRDNIRDNYGIMMMNPWMGYM